MIKKISQYFISKMKGRAFRFDQSVSDFEVLEIVVSELIALIRGGTTFFQFVSLGKGSTIFGKKKIFLGRGVSLGRYVTLSGIGKNGIEVGHGSSIGSFSIIKVSGSLMQLGLGIKIGRNVGIGDFSHIGGAGGVAIGEDTIIGAYFSVHPENHIYSDLDAPIRLQGVSHKGIKVGKNCWIGAKVTLLDGADIGNGCVVAAGAVVKGKFPDDCMIGGVPAKILKFRSNEN